MKNKKIWKLIAWYSSSIIFLIVGSIFAAAADKTQRDTDLFPIGFSVLFFFLFAIALGMGIYYSFFSNGGFKKKSSDSVQIDEIQKIEPISEE